LKQFKIYLLSVLIATLSLADDSNYQGKYLCNKTQVLEEKGEYFYIGNSEFKYFKSRKRHGLISDLFTNKANYEGASISPYKNETGYYSLNIRNLKSKEKAPLYVGRCKKVE